LVAKADSDFLNFYFTIALNSINEVALAFCVLDFDFKDSLHGFRASAGRSMELKAACNAVLFLKEIEEAEEEINKDIIVVQRYFEVTRQDVSFYLFILLREKSVNS